MNITLPLWSVVLGCLTVIGIVFNTVNQIINRKVMPQCAEKMVGLSKLHDENKLDIKCVDEKYDKKNQEMGVRVETIESVVKTGVNDMRLKTEIIHEDFIHIKETTDSIERKLDVLYALHSEQGKQLVRIDTELSHIKKEK